MSSDPVFAALTRANVNLITEVSRSADLLGSVSFASADMKRDASISLSAAFRGRARTKGALLEALGRRGRGVSYARPPKEDGIDRWHGEGGR